MSVRVLVGDCRETLLTLPDQSVQCVVTSPPYFGLRDYGTAKWEGGDDACDHVKPAGSTRGGPRSTITGGQDTTAHLTQFAGSCGKCGARRSDSQIGLEATPDAFVAELVSVFREVRRVLRDDGTLWLNLGDSYAGGGNYRGINSENTLTAKQNSNRGARGLSQQLGALGKDVGVEPKNLLGIPWRVAFALQADGWYLRSDIIWHKPNPMPESVMDRPTKAHEYLFLLAKSERYYYDADAIAEPAIHAGRVVEYDEHQKNVEAARDPRPHTRIASDRTVGTNRNRRTVWTVATQPYSGAHFATFPPALIEPCILAGSAKQACETCGAPWARVVEREGGATVATERPKRTAGMDSPTSTLLYSGGSKTWQEQGPKRIERGFVPTCDCETNTGAARSIVLDPFGGAGTTGLVADRLGRDAILCELNPTYAEMARRRITDDAPLFGDVA